MSKVPEGRTRVANVVGRAGVIFVAENGEGHGEVEEGQELRATEGNNRFVEKLNSQPHGAIATIVDEDHRGEKSAPN
jgi:hypothetical protein